MVDRAEQLRKRAAARSLARYGPRDPIRHYLCAFCRLEYDARPGRDECPHCDGHPRAERGR